MAAALAHRTRTSKSSVLSLPAFTVADINLRRRAAKEVLTCDATLFCCDGPSSLAILCAGIWTSSEVLFRVRLAIVRE